MNSLGRPACRVDAIHVLGQNRSWRYTLSMRQIVDYSKPGKQTGFALGAVASAAPLTQPQPVLRQVLNKVFKRAGAPGVLAVIGAPALVVFLAGCGSGTHTASLTVPVSKNPCGVALDAGTRTAFVTNSGDNTVSVIDSSTHTVTSTVPVGKNPQAVAVDPGTHSVYVANSDDNTVSVIDSSTHTVTATVPVGKNPDAAAVDPGTHAVYVANGGDNTVSVIDGPTRTLTATAWAGAYPDGVAVDPGTHTVYVANKDDATVSVIDGSARTVTATVRVVGRPMGVAVDPKTHTVYVTDSHGWTVSVIDGPKHTVTATMAEKPRDIRRVEFGGMAPWGVAVDPGSHAVYVANRGDASVWVIEHR